MNETGLPIDSKIFLNEIVHIEIDRPIGSTHPEYNMIYEVNYGFVPGIMSGDGEELDAYLLGISLPVRSFEGKCIAILKRSNQMDDKLIIVPDGISFSDEEILSLINFSEKYFDSILIRE